MNGDKYANYLFQSEYWNGVVCITGFYSQSNLGWVLLI